MKTVQDDKGIQILLSNVAYLILLSLVSVILMLVVLDLSTRADTSTPPCGVKMTASDIQTYKGLIDESDIQSYEGVYYVREYTLRMRIDTIRELSSGVKQITGYDINSDVNVLVNMNFITDFRVVDYSQGTMVEITNLVRKTNENEVWYTTTSESKITGYLQ